MNVNNNGTQRQTVNIPVGQAGHGQQAVFPATGSPRFPSAPNLGYPARSGWVHPPVPLGFPSLPPGQWHNPTLPEYNGETRVLYSVSTTHPAPAQNDGKWTYLATVPTTFLQVEVAWQRERLHTIETCAVVIPQAVSDRVCPIWIYSRLTTFPGTCTKHRGCSLTWASSVKNGAEEKERGDTEGQG